LKKLIAVCGSNEVSSTRIRDVAEKVGIEIARKNGILVCGGLGGVMECASRGAKKYHGITVGVLPDENINAANEFIDICMPTSLGKLRNFFVVNIADAVIGVSGSWGTLSELSMALNLQKPVIVIRNTGGIVDWLVNTPIDSQANKFLIANNPSDAVRLAFSLIK